MGKRFFKSHKGVMGGGQKNGSTLAELIKDSGIINLGKKNKFVLYQWTIRAQNRTLF